MVAPLAGQAAFGQSEPVPPDSWARRQELAQLGEITPNVAADFDPVLGTPTFIRSTTAFLTRRSGRTAAQIVADFVNDNPATFGVSLSSGSGGNLAGAEQFTPATYRTIRDFETPSLGPTGVRHLTYQQTHNGQDIYGSLLTANVTGDGMLVNIGSRFVTEPASPISPPACDEGNRTVRDVVAAACDEVGDTRIADIVNLIAPEAVCGFDWKDGHAVQGVGETALWVRSVLHPVSATELVQAWVVRLPSNPNQDDAAWECMVKHSDLSVLSTHDLTMHYCQPEPVTYRVYTDDSPVPGTPGLATLPGSGQNQDTETYFSPATRQLVTVTANDTGEWSPWGWLNEGATWEDESTNPPTTRPGFRHCRTSHGGAASQTCGNNVRVRRAADDTTVAAPAREFDFSLDLGQPPEAGENLNSAITQVFYLANVWHDRMYALGFGETAGNFQEDNFDRGGNPAGDALHIRVHDGLNNYGGASYLQGQWEDGALYQVKFAVMTGPAPDRSAALDRGVVFHELTHTMVARLLVGSSGGPKQAYGMHEGWADFFAVCLTAHSSDNLGAEYPMFAWAARENDLTSTGDPPISHYYFGARRFPYSADMSKDPVTFAHIDPCSSSDPVRPKPFIYEGETPPQNPELAARARDEEYTVGLVWATMLVECRNELSGSMGWAANDLAMQLVIEGIKLCPIRPNFVEARDAILQADVLRHGGVHLPALRTAFAKRGLGWGARSPNGGSACGVIESFEVAPTNDDELSVFLLDEPLIAIHTCEATTFDVLVVGNSRPVASVIGDAAPDPCILGLPSPAELVSPGTYRVTIGPGLCRQAWEVWATATTEGPNAASKSSPPMAVAAGVVEVVFARDMESGTSEWAIGMATPWVSGSSATAGAWFRGDPSGGGAVHPARDATPGPGYQCWMTEQHNPSGAGALLDDVDSGAAPGSDEDGVWLRSPNIALDALSPAIVEFQHWFASLAVNGGDTANDVEARADWVRDGTTVSGVGMSLPRGDASTVWRQRRFIAPSGGQTHQVRFHFMDLPPHDTAVEGGIDELRVYQVVSCADCCDADMNRDGNVDQDDVAYLVSVIGGGDNPACIDPDFNHDGNVDQTDIADLLSYVGGDGCP